MLAPILERLPITGRALPLRARRHLPATTSRTRCSPRTASSSSRRSKRPGRPARDRLGRALPTCFFVDDTGEFVAGDFITALYRPSRCSRRTRAQRSSTTSGPRRAVPDLIVASTAARAVASRVGHAFINAPPAQGERSSPGRSPAFMTSATSTASDTGIVPALIMLELRSKPAARSCPSSWLRLRERYHLSGEINSKVSDVPLKLQELKERYGPNGEGRRARPPRRPLGRLPRVALQRPPVEHRAAPAAQPRGVHKPTREMQRRRNDSPSASSAAEPMLEGTSPPPPAPESKRRCLLSRRSCGSASTRPTPTGGRLLRPLHPLLRPGPVEYLRHLGLLWPESGGPEFVMRRSRRVPGPRSVRRPLEVFIRVPGSAERASPGSSRHGTRCPTSTWRHRPRRPSTWPSGGRCASTTACAPRSSRSTRRSSA